MNRNTILEAMYEVIKDSTEWGVSEKEYGMFVDGVVAMTDAMLRELEAKDKKLKELDNKFLETAKNYTNASGEIDALVTTIEARI